MILEEGTSTLEILLGTSTLEIFPGTSTLEILLGTSTLEILLGTSSLEILLGTSTLEMSECTLRLRSTFKYATSDFTMQKACLRPFSKALGRGNTGKVLSLVFQL